MANIMYEVDKRLDVFTAHVKREILHPLETIESGLFDGNILFQVDSVTGELVKIVIYDFSVLRRKLLLQFVFLYTRRATENWLNMLISAFQAGNKSLHAPVQA